MNVNPSPKSRFQSNEVNIKEHRELMDYPRTERGIQFALLEYQRLLSETRGDMSVAAANHFKISGALEFLHVLRNLSETPEVPKTKPVGNLSHNV